MLSEGWSKLIAKSGPTTVTGTLAVWEFPPPEPVTETVYDPLTVELPTVTLRVVAAEDPEVMDTLELLRVPLIPAGVFGLENVTVPENPFKLETVRVEVCDAPCNTVRLEGLGVIVKSGGGGGWTVKVPIIAVWYSQ